MSFKYTTEMIDWLRTHQHLKRPDQQKQFNATFGLNKSLGAINNICRHHGFKSVIHPKNWITDEQLAFLETIQHLERKDQAVLFNEKFDTQFTAKHLNNHCYHRKIKSEFKREDVFQKGHKTWNKGKKGIHLSPETEFKKGIVPPSYKPLGSVTFDGQAKQWLIKVEDPNVWRKASHIIWEKAHGKKMEEGGLILFLDGNKNNLHFSNLKYVNRAVFAGLMRKKAHHDAPEHKEILIHVLQLQQQIKELSDEIPS